MKSELKITAHESRVLLAIVQHISSKTKKLQKQIALYRNYCDQVDVLPHKAKLHCILNIVADLMEQGWGFDFDQEKEKWFAFFDENSSGGKSSEEVKNEMRAKLMVGVKESFKKESFQAFVEKMHKTSRHQLPITNLIDCPKELMRALTDLDQTKEDFTRDVIDPYLQEVDDSRDEFTNLKLGDVWRYFRSTWSLEYKTNPGRSQPYLIRNKARPYHPVIGITMLASPVLNLKPRDKELCLVYDEFIDWLNSKKIGITELVRMMKEDLTDGLKRLDYKDLISAKDFRSPSSELINDIASKIEASTAKRAKFIQAGEDAAAENYLFEVKKLKRLRSLMQRKKEIKALERDIKKYDLTLERCYQNQKFQAIVNSYLASKRTEAMSLDVMDLSVCGAVSPYNGLIGGKLVALLMASQEVYDAFNKKYAVSTSEISKRVAGRNIRRRSNLKCITTTSLYGTHSSQYNRLKVNLKRKTIEYKKLKEKSMGYGTFQFSKHTQNLVTSFFESSGMAKSINYKFGEGTSPRLRRLMQAFRVIGFKGTEIFEHRQPRIVYFLDLHKSSADLIFLNKEKKIKLPSSNEISKAWRQRWLEKRINNPKIVKKMKSSSKEDYLLTKKIKEIINE